MLLGLIAYIRSPLHYELCVIVKSKNMFTFRGGTLHCTFVGAGSPSPYEPTVWEKNYGIYYKKKLIKHA